MVGATHIAASAMPLADMRYRDRRDQRESVGAGNGNCSLTDGQKRPIADISMRKRLRLQHILSGSVVIAVQGRDRKRPETCQP